MGHMRAIWDRAALLANHGSEEALANLEDIQAQLAGGIIPMVNLVNRVDRVLRLLRVTNTARPPLLATTWPPASSSSPLAPPPVADRPQPPASLGDIPVKPMPRPRPAVPKQPEVYVSPGRIIVCLHLIAV